MDRYAYILIVKFFNENGDIETTETRSSLYDCWGEYDWITCLAGQARVSPMGLAEFVPVPGIKVQEVSFMRSIDPLTDEPEPYPNSRLYATEFQNGPISPNCEGAYVIEPISFPHDEDDDLWPDPVE